MLAAAAASDCEVQQRAVPLQGVRQRSIQCEQGGVDSGFVAPVRDRYSRALTRILWWSRPRWAGQISRKSSSLTDATR